MAFDLVLDPKIRNWVLLPIVLIMLLVGIGRSLAQQLMQSNSSPDSEIFKHREILARSQRTRQFSGLLSPAAFVSRREYLVGVIKKQRKLAKNLPAPNPMQNSGSMMEMMKSNMALMIPNMVMMGWLSYFFSGFVLVKVPFSLTAGFREMLQRGINLESLDVSYVSSLSWYFLVMFGARGVFNLILGSNNFVDESQLFEQQMAGGIGKMNKQQEMQFDARKLYRAERQTLESTEPRDLLEEAEVMLLKSYKPKLK